ncbi:uncharacterized protein [Bemisia tabaci]|uniref:uncharacterized protein isoform X2 n=1 Tax=Bemisia tabaci TaxID=7038 RepID=UPI003B2849BE
MAVRRWIRPQSPEVPAAGPGPLLTKLRNLTGSPIIPLDCPKCQLEISKRELETMRRNLYRAQGLHCCGCGCGGDEEPTGPGRVGVHVWCGAAARAPRPAPRKGARPGAAHSGADTRRARAHQPVQRLPPVLQLPRDACACACPLPRQQRLLPPLGCHPRRRPQLRPPRGHPRQMQGLPQARHASRRDEIEKFPRYAIRATKDLEPAAPLRIRWRNRMLCRKRKHMLDRK